MVRKGYYGIYKGEEYKVIKLLDQEHKNGAIKLTNVDEINYTASYVDSKGNTVKSTYQWTIRERYL